MMASDGSRTTAGVVTPTYFYTASVTSAESVVRIADNPHIRDVVALAATADWVFFVGAADDAGGTSQRTVYRLSRTDLTAAPTAIAPADQLGFSASNGAMEYDAGRDVLYFRATSPAGVYAIFDASTATPVYAGPVLVRGNSGDYAMALDPSVPALFVFETETASTGTFLEVR